MENLEDKLEAIEKKVKRLIEQNTQYQRVCNDLLESKRRLESENAELKELLNSENPSDLPTEQKNQSSSPANRLSGEQLKKQIDQHIQAIDESIKWLSGL